MALKVVGAGLGRTGTFSLKLGLEQLLGGTCYHMYEVFQKPAHIPVWQDAADGKPVDWNSLMTGYTAAVDWPASAYWLPLAEANPDAVIVFSRRDPEAWWESASETIFKGIGQLKDRPDDNGWFRMVSTMMANHFTTDLTNKDAAITAFKKHEENVMSTAPKERLVVWEAKEGWEPLCKALDLPIPDQPFPRANTKEEFIARIANGPPAAHD
ncbi:MAG TPA: sulfotransferase [Fimbriimonas sp.]|nr:sulfotransferase [Fimbriimonas sp.]